MTKDNDDSGTLPPFVPPAGYPRDPENIVPFVHPRSTGGGAQQRLVMPRYRLQYEGDPDFTPPTGDLIKGVLPQIGVGFLGGATSTGKTYIALDAARAIQTGSDFAGYEVRKPGGVLIFAAEGGALIRQRWSAIKKTKVEPWLEQQGAAPGAMPLWWAIEMPKLVDPDAKEQLVMACGEVKQALIDKKHDCELVLIIIDTWAAMSNVAQAKETSETQKLMNMLQEVSRLVGAFILVVDHVGKDETKGLKDNSSKEQSADAILMVHATSTNGVLSNTRLVLRKARGGAAGAEIPFELVSTQIGTDDEDGSPINELTVNWQGVKQRKLGGRPNQGEVRFLEALNEALLERGVMTQPAPGYPTVKAVVEPHVREWFFSHYPPAGGDEQKRLKAARMAYTRAVTALCARKQVVSLTVGRDVDARTLLWRVKDDDDYEKQTTTIEEEQDS